MGRKYIHVLFSFGVPPVGNAAGCSSSEESLNGNNPFPEQGLRKGNLA
jgi:hypothetical protein